MFNWLKKLTLVTKITSAISTGITSFIFINRNSFIFENFWYNIYDNKLLTNPFFPMLLMTTTFLTVSAPFAILDFTHFIKSFKIQHERYPSKKQFITAIILWFKSEIYVNLPLTSLIYIMGFSTPITRTPPILGNFLYDIIVSFLLMDFLFFLAHRLLHTNWLYTNIHHVHHQFNNTFSYVSHALHPAETIIFASVSVIPIYLTSHHILTQYLLLFLVMINNIESHSGYNFINTYKWSRGILSGSTCHNLHHQKYIVNYSVYTTIWDRIFKTHSV